MSRRAWVLAFALIPAAAAGGAEPHMLPAAPGPDAPAVSRRPPLIEQFHLFSFTQLPRPGRRPLGTTRGQAPVHQAGDPDSLFTFGDSTPEGELHLKAAIELNEIHLEKAIPPDASQGLGEIPPARRGQLPALRRIRAALSASLGGPPRLVA